MTIRPENENQLRAEIAELKKADFIKLVAQFAGLRDLQYNNDMAPQIVKQAEQVVALNLPSNLLRAAVIFVDWMYGFPPDKSNFGPPLWVTERQLLPEQERGSLVCKFNSDKFFTEKQTVVLIVDLPEHELHAGMAGIVRELPPEDEEDGTYFVEFGEPEDSITKTIEVSPLAIRRPRPGDMLENYRE